MEATLISNGADVSSSPSTAMAILLLVFSSFNAVNTSFKKEILGLSGLIPLVVAPKVKITQSLLDNSFLFLVTSVAGIKEA